MKKYKATGEVKSHTYSNKWPEMVSLVQTVEGLSPTKCFYPTSCQKDTGKMDDKQL